MPEGNWPLRKSWMIKYKQQTRSQRAGKSVTRWGHIRIPASWKDLWQCHSWGVSGEKEEVFTGRKEMYRMCCHWRQSAVPEETYTLYHYAFGLGFWPKERITGLACFGRVLQALCFTINFAFHYPSWPEASDLNSTLRAQGFDSCACTLWNIKAFADPKEKSLSVY